MPRKHFDRLMIMGSYFVVGSPVPTPCAHGVAAFRLTEVYAHKLHLDLWTGFGNAESPAGTDKVSVDPREIVPTDDPKRSGRAFRDGWQPIAIVDKDARSVEFVSRSVNDTAYICHVASEFVAAGYTVFGIDPVAMEGATITGTTIARNGAPKVPQFRNTDANSATHRERARERGNALMEFGKRNN